MTCLCHAIPKARLGQVLVGIKVVAAFHQDCPEHGVVVTLGPVMRAVKRQMWVTPEQAAIVRTYEGARLIKKADDKKTALVEWTEWTSDPEEKEAA